METGRVSCSTEYSNNILHLNLNQHPNQYDDIQLNGESVLLKDSPGW